jgi:hypothetical protein
MEGEESHQARYLYCPDGPGICTYDSPKPFSTAGNEQERGDAHTRIPQVSLSRSALILLRVNVWSYHLIYHDRNISARSET